MTNLADKFTVEKKKQLYYSDFLTNLDKNPVSGFLAKVTNEESVGQAIKNLIFTKRGERFQDSKKGSAVMESLFEPVDSITSEDLKSSIREVISNYEPRAKLNDVIVNAMPDKNAYFVQIVYGLINIPDQLFTLQFVLFQRVR